MSFSSIRRRWVRLRAIWQTAIIGMLAIAASAVWTIVTPEQANRDSLEVLVGTAYFLFGVFVAFALESARSRMAKVDDLLKTDEANLLALYVLAEPLGRGVRGEIRFLIDALLQDQIDFTLVDFHRSAPAHQELFGYIVSLADSQDESAPLIREQMLTTMLQINSHRTQVEAATSHGMSPAEWTSIFALFALLFAALPVFSSGVTLGTVAVALLSGVLAVFVSILWSVDHLQWQEATWIWRPLDRLFNNLGLIPYYPQDVLDERRANPEPGPIRVATYPHPYPDMTGKSVSMRDWP